MHPWYHTHPWYHMHHGSTRMHAHTGDLTCHSIEFASSDFPNARPPTKSISAAIDKARPLLQAHLGSLNIHQEISTVTRLFVSGYNNSQGMVRHFDQCAKLGSVIFTISSGGHDSLRFYANKHDTLGHVYQLGNGDAVALARHQEHSVDANMHHNRISMVIFF